MATAAAALCVPLSSLLFAGTPAIAQAPYPPGEPCVVSATSRGPVATNGATEYDVVGSGLGSAQPVRVLLAASGRQVGAARTDESGSFRTMVALVTAPTDTEASSPGITVSSPQQTCSSPPVAPSISPTASGNGPGNGSGGSTAGGNGSGPTVAPGGTTAGSGSGPTSGAGPAGGSSGPSARQSASGSTSGSGPGSTSGPESGPGTTAAPTQPSVPPLAQPIPGSDTPFGIGLAIAAVLLVLGTLAVLLLTRRPER